LIKTASVNTTQLRRVVLRQSYLFPLLLLVIAVAINYALEPNFFQPAALSGNLQSFLPLMLLAAGQAIVIIGGGVDLSLGAIVSLVTVVMVHTMGSNPGASQTAFAIALGFISGILAGALNGFCVAILRFQPIVTTFATSYVFSGLALLVMPSPGGSVPADLMNVYLSNPLGIPLTIWVIVIILLLWNLLRSTRFSRYLFAVGGQSMSAYVTGVPVSLIRFSTYVLAGLMAALSGFALVLSTGTGDPLVGAPMTLESIVAVVLGGTRLSGGQGGITGAFIGVIILSLILNIIFFANVPSWWQTLVNGLIVLLALTGPGIVAFIRGRLSPATERLPFVRKVRS
jgi:ribose transport system permease protein